MVLARTFTPSARETEARLVYKAGSRATQRNLGRKKKKPDPDDSQNQLPFFNNCFEIELFLIAKDLTDKYFILLIYEHLKIPTVIEYTRVFKVKMRRGKGFLNYH